MELVIAAAAAGLLMTGVYAFLTSNAKNDIKLSKYQDWRITSRLTRNQLSQWVGGSITGKLFLNQTLATQMGLGLNIGWLLTPEDAGGSIFVAPGRMLSGSMGTSTGTADFYVIALVLNDSSVSALSTATDITFTDAQSVAGAETDIAVTGSVANYTMGDMVAVTTPIGIQFFPLVTNASPGLIRVRCDYALLPARFLPGQSAVQRVKILLMGKDDVTNKLRAVEFRSGASQFSEVVLGEITPTLFQVQSLVGATDLNNGLPVVQTSLVPHANGAYLRIVTQHVRILTEPTDPKLDIAL